MPRRENIISIFKNILERPPIEKEINFLLEFRFSFDKIKKDLKKTKEKLLLEENTKNIQNFETWERFCHSNNYIFENFKEEPLPENNLNLVFIDFRILSSFEFIIKNAIYRIGKKCMMTFVCGENNFFFVSRICQKISNNIKIIKISENIENVEDYNKLLLDISFWSKLKGEKILIHQFDAFIFKDNVDDFLSFDYIGSPWSYPQKGCYVGNGGFSLRNKKLMMDILRLYDHEDIYEDVFFSYIIEKHKLGKIGTIEEAKTFSRESLYYDSFGGHKFWECQDINLEMLNISLESKNTFSSKDHHRQLCKNNINLIKQIILPTKITDSFNEVFLIEFRIMDHLEFLIRNAIIKFPSWSHTVVCGNLNYNYIEQLNLPITIIKLDIDNSSQKEYNNLLLSKDFWNMFKGEKLLLYQEDSVIFHNRIERFMKYDFIGAPWPLKQNDNKHNVGNGGFSLRTKSKLIECLNRISPKKLKLGSSTANYMKNVDLKIPPEDVYFSKTMIDYDIGKVATYEEGRRFSQESIAGVDPMGGHHYWIPGKHPPIFKNYKLVNDLYFKEVTHRGGWKTIINDMISNNIISDNGNVFLLDMTEKYFVWDEMPPITKEWVGILHLTPSVPDHLKILEIDKLLKNKNFIISLKKCKCLIVLSKYMEKYLNNRININIKSIKHPVDMKIKKWNFISFLVQKWNLVQLGQQLRFATTIYTIKSPYPKIWLPGNNDIDKMKNLVENESKWLKNNINFKDVDIMYTNSYKEYDNMITNNIIIINLINASANNSVLELISSETPFFINRIKPVEEYLGVEYPMFFDNIEEVEYILNNKNKMIEIYKETNKYIKNIDKKDISFDFFYSEILKVIN